MKYVIYKLTNGMTGKAYIGKTIDLPARLRKHKSDDNCIYLHRAIKKYGMENFTKEVLAESDDEEQAYRIEELMIVEHKTLKPFGYNLLERDGIHRKLGVDSLEKLAHSLQGRNDLDKHNSTFIGVRSRKGTASFEVRIRCKGVRYQRYFPTEIEAAEAYDKMAVHFYGATAKINFIDNLEEYLKMDLSKFPNTFNQYHKPIK
jgi:group I intron endonuclease